MQWARKRRLQKHVDKLLTEHRIKATVKDGRGHANVKKRTVVIPPIMEEMDYFVSLHEIGHIVNGLGGLRLEREGKAWTWAYANSTIDPHYSTRQRVCSLLVRYYFRAQKNKWEIPEDGDFWDNMIWW